MLLDIPKMTYKKGTKKYSQNGLIIKDGGSMSFYDIKTPLMLIFLLYPYYLLLSLFQFF